MFLFKWLFIPTLTEENFSLFNLFHLETGCLKSTREIKSKLSVPPCPQLRSSASLFDLSLYLKNLKLIFPSWTKLEEEGRCFIKRFFIPPASTIFLFIYKENLSFCSWENVFRNYRYGKLIHLFLILKRKREKRWCRQPH